MTCPAGNGCLRAYPPGAMPFQPASVSPTAGEYIMQVASADECRDPEGPAHRRSKRVGWEDRSFRESMEESSPGLVSAAGAPRPFEGIARPGVLVAKYCGIARHRFNPGIG
jgi:hypothetical protein